MSLTPAPYLSAIGWEKGAVTTYKPACWRSRGSGQDAGIAVASGLAREVERFGQVARRRPAGGQHGVFAHLQPRQFFQLEPPRDEARDRTGVVDRVLHVTLLRERRNHQRGNTRAGAPAVALRRRHVIPPAAVLVEG